MTVARIPFSPEQEGHLTTLSQWMLFFVVIHALIAVLCIIGGCLGTIGSFGMFAVSAGYGILSLLQMLCMVLLGAAAGVEAGLLFQTKTELDAIVNSDDADQAHLAKAFEKLKLFFMLEIAFGGLGAIINLLAPLMAFVTPEIVPGVVGIGGLQ